MALVVSERARALASLLEAWDGQVEPLNRLEELIRRPEPPATELIGQLMAAVRGDLGDVPRALAALPNLSPDEVLHLSRRLGWTVRALSDWEPHQDQPGLRIEAALASAAAWDEAGCIWDVLRPQLENRGLTLAALEIVLRGRAPQALIPDDTPIWEREHFRALQEAEQARDWAQLGDRAQAFQRPPVLDFCATQAVRGLASLDWLRLIRVADRAESWIHGHMLLSPLALADAFRVARASASGHVRFAALERVVRRERRTLSPDEETALRNLLIILARDEDEWPGWLALCNRYPVRCSHIQGALGRALACSSDEALRAYVNSISLDTSPGEGRDYATLCLTVFHARAKLSRRRVLWRRAYDRWQTWDFNRAEGQGFSGIARCIIDYAIVGWLIEGGNLEEIPDIEQVFECNLQAINLHWYPSLSEAATDFRRLISRYQVFAHVRDRPENSTDWLPGPGVRLPLAADAFTQRRFRWNGH